MIFRSFIYARKRERCTDANNTFDSAETDNSFHFPHLSLRKKQKIEILSTISKFSMK